ncbi:MAG TPA: ABC transporter substrate-binding protein [Actinomycetes bacterium]|jgi:peptide/nickel transport system substrate-binding protein|nr:ABC transporter substrate-binding protein [Actinomycetes bacterium]
MRIGRPWVLLLAALLLVAACDGGGDVSVARREPTRAVKRGTLRIVNQSDVEALDPGIAYAATDLALLRGMARELYSFDSRLEGERALVPVPDLADGPYRLSPDGRTYTFRIRRGVRYAPPVDREVQAEDFIYAVERQFHPKHPSPNPYAVLIKGVAEFAAGKAKSISGMRAPSSHTLEITLDQPANDFPSILTLPFFSPVPEEPASRYEPGPEYAKHLIASGPYRLKQYTPGKLIELVRNPNWDPRTDPLRSAWVDRITVTIGRSEAGIQQAIEDGEADLNLDGVPPPNADLQRLSSDPMLAKQFAVETTGCVHYLTLQMDAGPTTKLAVRQAVNYAIDRQGAVLALGGRYAGEPASTILSPTLEGYSAFDLYPSQDAAGDPDKAKELLAKAGYPDGVTLTYVGQSSEKWKALYEVLRSSLLKAGIHLKPTFYKGYDAYTKSLRLRSKRDEHHLGAAGVCPDVPGNGSRSIIGVLLDGRIISPTSNNNFGSYDNAKVNALIDQAYGTRDTQARNALWGQIDRLLMEDAAWAPLVYDRKAFFWSSRVRNWTFTPWLSDPDIANLWLDPNTP